MFSTDEIPDICQSMDNLRILKYLFDVGMDVKKEGYWVYYQGMSDSAGLDFIISGLNYLFDSCELLDRDDEDSDPYELKILKVESTRVAKLVSMFPNTLLNEYFKKWTSDICDYTTAEMKILFRNYGLQVEFHDYAYYFSQFTKTLIAFKNQVEHALAHPEELVSFQFELNRQQIELDAVVGEAQPENIQSLEAEGENLNESTN